MPLPREPRESMSAKLTPLVEQRLREYLAAETGDTDTKVVRDLHPRSETVVVLKFELAGEEQVRYMNFNPDPGKPFPHLTAEDPHPLH